MKSSLRLNLLSVAKRSLLGFAAAVAAVLALESAVLAAPIPLDIYQDMESGNNGDVLTATIMNASNHGAYGWQATSGTMWVSTKYPKDLPGPVSVGGVTYNGTGGTRTWKVNNNNIQNYVQVGLAGAGYTYITIACYYATETTITSRQQYDAIVMFGNHTFCVMQNVMDDANGPYLRSHSNVSGVTHYGPNIQISDGKPYWINLHFDGNAPTASLAVYDPDNGFAQVGSTSVCPSTQDVMTWKCMFGRQDNHGNESRDTTQSWYDHICVDYTNHIFPLIPSSGTDSTPPSAPGTVRDGTGTDIAYTTSTTQLSANWDASSDAQSGISGYQYAIGTSAGGTQTVNWTSLGNVTTVTKTGLSLTGGQTYYFSVKAVNGAGLTGSATNSNGQTVDTTAPSAPANVRDGVGADISTTTSTTQLSANWDASADAESGISGYQYAIGTSAGGTQTVNWTSLGNVTTVTKTSLTLTVGQTYYFSVKAVNGAGLTGSATNSNGQTVVAASNVVYFSDNFESWTVHGGAWSSVNGESSTHTLDTSTDYAKAGAKCLKTTDTDTTATTGASLTKNFSPVISGDIYVRFFVFLPTGFGSANSTCIRRIVRVYTDAGSYTLISLTGDNLAVYEVGGWTGTGATAISENAWHCVELHVAPPSASTAIQYWIDGVSAGTCTGAFSGASTFNSMMFGDVALATSGSTNGTGTIYWDEVVVSNYYNGTNATTTYFSDNFENWTVHGGAWSSTSGENVNHTLNTSTDYARAGTKSLKLTDTDTTATAGACLVKNFSPVITTDIYVRFYVFIPTGFNSTNTNCNRRLLRVWCGSNRSQITIRPLATVMEEVGAWGAATGPALSENAWHAIEMHVAPPSASTALQFWIDGTSAGTLTANYSPATSFSYMEFGDVTLGSGNNGTGTFYLDEIVASDTYNGLLP